MDPLFPLVEKGGPYPKLTFPFQATPSVCRLPHKTYSPDHQNYCVIHTVALQILDASEMMIGFRECLQILPL